MCVTVTLTFEQILNILKPHMKKFHLCFPEISYSKEFDGGMERSDQQPLKVFTKTAHVFCMFCTPATEGRIHELAQQSRFGPSM